MNNPQQHQPLSFQDLMGLFSMLQNQTQQGIQGVNQMQEFQQRQQEQPLRMQMLQNQAAAPELALARQESQDELAQKELILRALGQIQADPYGGQGNQAAILDALRQQFNYNPQVPLQPQNDVMAKWQQAIQ